MNLEEYKEWLSKKGNKEETCAYNVVKEILLHHDYLNKNVDITPRHVFVVEYERIEFDLLIDVPMNKNPRRIGIEFKEIDIAKVVKQALIRRPFVDYMYIATRVGAYASPEDLMLLSYFGIGWVVADYDNCYVMMLIPAYYKYSERKLPLPISFFIDVELENAVVATMRKLKEETNDKKVKKTLIDFWEEMGGKDGNKNESV